MPTICFAGVFTYRMYDCGTLTHGLCAWEWERLRGRQPRPMRAGLRSGWPTLATTGVQQPCAAAADDTTCRPGGLSARGRAVRMGWAVLGLAVLGRAVLGRAVLGRAVRCRAERGAPIGRDSPEARI